ncbi:serine/threonine-protein phosphatase 5-like [Dysidea avara]|uniref:serine/threonine-protein phosphatase 5-like n=1 Tax=Dysidea avara TaxID=196820 RepID=UPI003330193D
MADSSGPSATPEDVAKAEEHKNKANEYFKDKKYVEAVEFYTRAIDLNPSVASYYGNRSIAHLRTEAFGYALQDASKTLELDKNYIKGYYRRASAYMAMGKFKLALKDYELVKKVRSKDKDAIQKYEECNKIVKWMAFQKAIAVDTTYTSVADSINLDTIDVEDSYSGPKLDDDISAGFMKNMLQWFKDQKKLHKKYCYKIMLEAKKLFEATQTLCDIKIPDSNKFTVCGDIHGQFYDLLNIFELNGVPSQDNPYLFNGDFVDRGSFSFEVILVLFGYKVLYPQHFYMARGNHESINMNQMYGFEGETKAKYSSHMFELFTEIFNWLPLAHCINEKVLVMHGGLFSRDDVKLDEIRKIDRFRQPSDEGLMCELLWSDPQPMNGRSPSKRGVGIHFGPDVTEQFCSLNKLEFIIRSHEVKDNGYEVSHNGKCITVFSAPNYCDQMGNKGAFITLTNDLKPKFTTYEAVPHPNVRPMQYANPLFGLGF